MRDLTAHHAAAACTARASPACITGCVRRSVPPAPLPSGAPFLPPRAAVGLLCGVKPPRAAPPPGRRRRHRALGVYRP
eukprot:SAG22_NODE_767_length_7375_cov_24.094055_3_plen_78_part_00